MDRYRSHYDWLNDNFANFLGKLGRKNPEYYLGMISAHGDKCYSYRDRWEKENIPFEHGVALYLLLYLNPWQNEVRDQRPDGQWKSPVDWVIENYNQFKNMLEPIDKQ